MLAYIAGRMCIFSLPHLFFISAGTAARGIHPTIDPNCLFPSPHQGEGTGPLRIWQDHSAGDSEDRILFLTFPSQQECLCCIPNHHHHLQPNGQELVQNQSERDVRLFVTLHIHYRK